MSEEVGKLDVVMTASGGQVISEVDKVNAKFDQMVAKSKDGSRAIGVASRDTSNAIKGIGGAASDAYGEVAQATNKALADHVIAHNAFAVLFGERTQKMADQVIAFIDRADSLAGSVVEGFKPFTQAEYLANDSMEVVNATLVNQANLLEHLPMDHAALAMAKAKVEADQLATSLDELDQKMEAVLSKNHLSQWAVLTGREGTSRVEGTINSFSEQIKDKGYEAQEAIRRGDTAGFAKADKERRDLLASEHANLQRDIAIYEGLKSSNRLGGMGKDFNASAVLSDLKSSDRVVVNEMDADKLRDQNAVLQKRIGGDQDAARVKQDQSKKEMEAFNAQLTAMKQAHLVSAAEEEAFWKRNIATVEAGGQSYVEINRKIGDLNQTAIREGRAAALAAERKAQQLQMQGFKEGLSSLEQSHKLAIGEEYFFWLEMQMGTKEGSENWLAINEKLGPLYQQALIKLDEAAKKRAEVIKKWDAEAQRYADEMDKAQHRGSDNQAEYTAAVERNAGEMLALQVAHDIGTSAISRHDAAVILATQHAKTYEAALQRLREEAQHDLDDASLTQDQRDANAEGRRVRQVDIEGNRDRTAFNDAQTIRLSTVSGAAADALEKFTVKSLDAAQVMAGIVSSSIDRTNQSILRAITGQHPDFGNAGKDIFANVSGSLLKGGEAELLKGLGIGGGGKPDGTSSNPLHVIMAQGGRMADIAKSGLGSMFSKLFGGGGVGAEDTATSSFASIFGPGSLAGAPEMGGGDSGLFASFLEAMPGFAAGGDPEPNSWAMVGEQGPEPVYFGSTPARVYPNKQMSAAGGFNPTIHVDARGSHDPAALEAAVNRGVMAAAPHIIAASVGAVNGSNARMPATARR